MTREDALKLKNVKDSEPKMDKIYRKIEKAAKKGQKWTVIFSHVKGQGNKLFDRDVKEQLKKDGFKFRKEVEVVGDRDDIDYKIYYDVYWDWSDCIPWIINEFE